MPRTMTDAAKPILDTLKLTEAEWHDIAQYLDDSASRADLPANKRKAKRERFSKRSALIFRVAHPGGTEERYLIRTRNLSDTGLCFLHGSFLYPRSECVVTLQSKDRKTIEVSGTVVRCRHITGKVHEVGIKFRTPIASAEYLDEAIARR